MTDKPSKPDIVIHTKEQLFRKLDDIRKNAPPLEPLWGYFLFRKHVTSIVGDPGVCKTTFGYGLGMTLCKGETFLEIKPEEPIRVLYMDFESADSLIASRASLISGETTPNFYIFNIVDYHLPHIYDHACSFCDEKSVNLIFIDNQSMAFHTRDENDNAEAIKQMRLIRSFAQSCNCAVVVFHHTSKADLAGTRKGTGAYARARLADICVNINRFEDPPDVVGLETVKNRLVDAPVLWYLKKEEGQFHFTEPPMGVSGQPTDTAIYKAQQEILSAVNSNKEYKHNELITILEAKNIDSATVGNALKRLLQQGRLVKPRYGYYAKKLVS